jgi:alpha-1,2-mannosyltransferase
LANGQVNLLVAALVLVDVTVLRGRRGHGIATGLATGIKLTPALFVLVLAGTRQWRATATAVSSFAATVVVGAVLAPGESKWYWTGGLLHIERVGTESALGNQSLVGLAARALGHPQVPIAVTATIGVLTVAGCLPLLRRLHRAGLHLTGAAACGVLAVLITPISWSHHWIWLPLLAVCAWRSGTGWAWATAVTLVLAIDARWLATTLGGPSWQHGWQAQVMASCFAALAAAVLLVGAQRLRHRGPPDSAIARCQTAGGDEARHAITQ